MDAQLSAPTFFPPQNMGQHWLLLLPSWYLWYVARLGCCKRGPACCCGSVVAVVRLGCSHVKSAQFMCVLCQWRTQITYYTRAESSCISSKLAIHKAPNDHSLERWLFLHISHTTTSVNTFQNYSRNSESEVAFSLPSYKIGSLYVIVNTIAIQISHLTAGDLKGFTV